MHIVRVLVLVLTVALLPLRGGMAASMPCSSDTGSAHGQHAMHAMHDGAHAHGDHGKSSSDGKPTQHGCQLCAACCTMTPLAHAVPDLPLPGQASVLSYLALQAPAPRFLSDGPERPPRSI